MSPDDEIIANFRQRTGKSLRRLKWQLVAVLLYATLCCALYGLAIKAGWLTRYGIKEDIIYLLPLPVLFAQAFVSSRKLNQPRLEDLPPRVLRKQIDHYQQRWRSVLAGLMVFLALSAITTSYLAAASDIIVDKMVARAFLLLFAASCALGAIFYPGLKIFDDERLQALRARTAKFGFVFLLMLFGIALLLALQFSEWTEQIFIWAIAASGAAPALYYIIADWRAGREE